MTDSKYTMKTISILSAIIGFAFGLAFGLILKDSPFDLVSELLGLLVPIGVIVLSMLISSTMAFDSMMASLRQFYELKINKKNDFDRLKEMVSQPSVLEGLTVSDEDKMRLLVSQIQEKGFGGRFNPRVYQQLGIEIDERKWIKRISEYVRQGHLAETYELMCPNCHEIIDVYSKYKDIPLDQTISCVHCAHDFEVSEQWLVPMYSFVGDMELKEPLHSSAENPISQADK
jgi:hypothetical protein